MEAITLSVGLAIVVIFLKLEVRRLRLKIERLERLIGNLENSWRRIKSGQTSIRN